MSKDNLIAASIAGDHARTCAMIGGHRELRAETFDDLSGNGRKSYLVHVATFTCQEKVLLELDKQGVDLNAIEPTHKGWTALNFFAQHRNAAIAQIQRQNKVDLSMTDSHG